MKLFVVVTLLAIMLAACGKSDNNASTQGNGQNNGAVKVQQTATPKQEIKDPGQVASRLEKLATSIPQVKSANCVVFGNTAVVGINVSPELDRARVGTIKYSVAEALRKDPYGANAIVTADMDLAQRIREIRDDINNGRPVAGFAEEMADIIGRIVPLLPRDLTPLNSSEVNNQNTNHDAKKDANQLGDPNL